MMPEGIQRWMEAEGEEGCLLLTLMHVGELESGQEVQPALEYPGLLHDGLITWDCFVRDVGAVVSRFSFIKGTIAPDKPWIALKAGDGKDADGRPYDLPLAYVIQPGEHDVGMWRRAISPTQKMEHFAYRGPQAFWDPYGGAETIKDGQLVERLILRRKAT